MLDEVNAKLKRIYSGIARQDAPEERSERVNKRETFDYLLSKHGLSV